MGTLVEQPISPGIDHVDVFKRAAKTFVATFLATILLSTADFANIPSISVLKKLVVAAASAAVTAVINYILQIAQA